MRVSQTMHAELFQFVLTKETSQFGPILGKVEVVALGFRDDDIFRLDTMFKK